MLKLKMEVPMNQMVKTYLILFFCFVIGSYSEKVEGAGIEGYWMTMNEKTHLPQSIIGIYPYEGKYYGRLLVTYDDDGKLDGTLKNPKDRAPGIIGHPYYVGLDILYGLKPEGEKYVDGKIVDPEKGDIYDAEMWLSKDKLIVRGEILFFGENQVWQPVNKENWPAGVEMTNMSGFVPVIPKTS